MNENFDRCFDFLMTWEGGYSNDPNDPGGETNFGISKRVFPYINIKDLDIEGAKRLYRDHYWTQCNCQTRPWPWDFIVFDTAVNMGVKKALVLYQENQDYKDYLLARMQSYINISSKTRDKFLKGWINRVLALDAEIRRK